MKRKFALAALLPLLSIVAQASTTAPSQPEPFENGWQIAAGTMNVAYGPYCTMQTGFPVLLDPTDKIDEAKDVLRLQLNDLFRKSAEVDLANFKSYAGQTLECGNAGSASVQMTQDWSLAYHDSELVSISYDVYSYTGGAHGMEYVRSLNMGLASGRVYALSDILTRQAIDPIVGFVKNALTAQNRYDEDFFKFWLENIKSVDDLAAFTFDAKGITLHFAPYAVGPYAMGPSDVSIPWTFLKPYELQGSPFNKF